MADDGMMNLSAVVAATCPTMLIQSVIQAAKGAPRGLEIMAAQKYPPPWSDMRRKSLESGITNTIHFRIHGGTYLPYSSRLITWKRLY
jgi:hypothetical protein